MELRLGVRLKPFLICKGFENGLNCFRLEEPLSFGRLHLGMSILFSSNTLSMLAYTTEFAAKALINGRVGSKKPFR